MSKIHFEKVNLNEIENFRCVFDFISSGKQKGSIDEKGLSSLLAELRKTRFHPAGGNGSWDYGSWVDALIQAAISFQSLEVSNVGEGVLVFTEHSWPSGGLETVEEIVKIFGGRVVLNDAS